MSDGRAAHTLTGDIRRHGAFASKYVWSGRNVLVYLPPGYEWAENGERCYPTLYLHDGQNLFDGATAFVPGIEWQVDEAAQSLIQHGQIEPVIIVAVDNAGMERLNEYTPSHSPRMKAGGHADAYGQFLAEELKPFIDTTYRTKPDAANTGLGGSSLGGLVTAYLGLVKAPEIWGRLAIISPSVWWDSRFIVRTLCKEQGSAQPFGDTWRRVWVDMGTQESANGIRDARALRDALTKCGMREGVNLCYTEVDGGEHNEQAWAHRIAWILRYLFPA